MMVIPLVALPEAIMQGGVVVALSFISVTVMGPVVLLFALKREMPFRVYAEGLTRTTVGFIDGYHDREELVGFDQLDVVKVVVTRVLFDERRHLRIDFRDDRGRHRFIRPASIDDVRSVLKALDRMAPDKLDGTAVPFIEGAGVPGRTGRLSRLSGSMGWTVMLFTAILTVPVGGVFYWSAFNLFAVWGDPPSWFRTGEVFVVAFGTVVFAWLTYFVAKGVSVDIFERHGHVSPDGLTVPRPPPLRAFVTGDGVVPLSRVVLARRVLDPSLFRDRTHVVLEGGEDFMMSGDIFSSLQGMAGFEFDGNEAKNQRSERTDPGSLFVPNGVGLVVFCLLLFTFNRLLTLFALRVWTWWFGYLVFATFTLVVLIMMALMATGMLILPK